MRITRQHLNGAFERYVRAVKAAGVSVEGHELALFEGSKTYGNPFEVWWIRPADRQRIHAPGGEFLGWTKREAYNTLSAIAQALEDVKRHRGNPDA